MTPDVKIEPTIPLPSEALESDAREAGVAADERTDGGADTPAPASESERSDEESGAEVERDLSNLPPD